MSTSKGSKLSMKVVMNKQKSKVLFAEAGSDVVDVLLSFLTLPLGQIVRILEKHYDGRGGAPTFGSITTLYRGLSNLDSAHFCVGGAKQMLMNPTNSFRQERGRLKIDVSGTQPLKVYFCENLECPSNVSLYADVAKCVCGKLLNKEALTEEDPSVGGGGGDGHSAGVFLNKPASFIVSDDLRIVPVEADFIRMLNSFGVTEIDGAEMSILSLGMNDVMDLFMYSLISSTPLTDLVIKKSQKRSTVTNPHPSLFLHHTQNGHAESRNMVLKVFLQKSTNKFLLAVAKDEFVEFLFSFLAISLGGVEHLLRGKTCLNNVNNLYTSVIDMIDAKHFKTLDMKDLLVKPSLPHGYVSKNQFLPLTEESAPEVYKEDATLTFKRIEGEGSFVKKGTMYIVGDDLTVTPFAVTSSLTIPNRIGVALSDVTTRDFRIGVEEGLSILKASLSSATPLTDALIKPMLNKLLKRPKQEPVSNELPKQPKQEP